MPLEEVLPDASPQALDLLGQFLLYPPHQRIAASQVSLKVVVTVLILILRNYGTLPSWGLSESESVTDWNPRLPNGSGE